MGRARPSETQEPSRVCLAIHHDRPSRALARTSRCILLPTTFDRCSRNCCHSTYTRECVGGVRAAPLPARRTGPSLATAPRSPTAPCLRCPSRTAHNYNSISCTRGCACEQGTRCERDRVFFLHEFLTLPLHSLSAPTYFRGRRAFTVQCKEHTPRSRSNLTVSAITTF